MDWVRKMSQNAPKPRSVFLVLLVVVVVGVMDDDSRKCQPSNVWELAAPKDRLQNVYEH